MSEMFLPDGDVIFAMSERLRLMGGDRLDFSDEGHVFVWSGEGMLDWVYTKPTWNCDYNLSSA